MSDYTPTTMAMRQAYVAMNATSIHDGQKVMAEFDRWLTAHDAEIRRIAFVEIVNGVNLIDVCEQDAYQRGRDDGWMIALADADFIDRMMPTRVLPSVRGGGSVVSMWERLRATVRGDGEQT